VILTTKFIDIVSILFFVFVSLRTSLSSKAEVVAVEVEVGVRAFNLGEVVDFREEAFQVEEEVFPEEEVVVVVEGDRCKNYFPRTMRQEWPNWENQNFPMKSPNIFG
jgi:hypothetical protein